MARFESKRREKLYLTKSGELATDKQLWKINQLSTQLNNVLIQIEELGGRAFIDVYCGTLRINLPISRRDASKAILQLQEDLDFKQRELERCKADA
tara:strand:- start:38 stop:325 length:288 start_codon:yes stop_codon:yes gene_type:complete